jgi:hypothetical protein
MTQSTDKNILQEFEKFYEEYCYLSDGFELDMNNHTVMLKTWSDNKEFYEKFRSIGQANNSGSNYSIWDINDSKDYTNLPIVVFGDEGGIHIVAENILQFLTLLTIDREIYVSIEEAEFYMYDLDPNHHPDVEKYKEWLKKEFDLEPITVDQANQIIKNAQEKYGKEFNTWLSKYVNL